MGVPNPNARSMWDFMVDAYLLIGKLKREEFGNLHNRLHLLQFEVWCLYNPINEKVVNGNSG